MSTSVPDAPASVPSAPESGRSGPVSAARGRRWLRKWVGQLGDIGVGLWDWMHAYRRSVPEAQRTIDVELAWALVGRAMSWAWALRARMNAEAKAALAEQPRPPEPPPMPMREWEPKPWDPTLEQRSPVARLARPDAAIEGKSAVEVVTQICCDLDAAAALLGNAAVAPAVAAIAAAARALLGAPSATWKALPVVRWADRAVGQTKAAVTPAVAAPVAVPGTG